MRSSVSVGLRSPARRPARTVSLVLALLATVVLGGCSRLFGGGPSADAVQDVPTNVDSTLRIAATQLRHHGYEVRAAGDNSVLTELRRVPTWLAEAEPQMANQLWFVQVNAESHFLMRGTRLEVIGFMVPAESTMPQAGGAATTRNAVVVTPEHRLYQEVRNIAGWIGDAARRRS